MNLSRFNPWRVSGLCCPRLELSAQNKGEFVLSPAAPHFFEFKTSNGILLMFFGNYFLSLLSVRVTNCNSHRQLFYREGRIPTDRL